MGHSGCFCHPLFSVSGCIEMVCPAEMADVIVIGAGPTGVFSAQILAAGGFSVTLVCESSKGPSRHQYHRFSPNIQFDHFSGFGGGTNLWANVCRPHDQQDYVRFSNQKLYPERSHSSKRVSF